MENKQSYRYHAFISYRHADNKEQGRQWATWLHHAIETYEVPKDLVGKKNGRGDTIPARIYPVFRDEQELPAHADLGSSIVNALTQTRLLIVLCSPRAVSSTYVADEIDYFKKLGGSDRIIAAMIDGEPNASWDKGKIALGFNKDDECFPQPLQFEYDKAGNPTEKRAEPIAADFRINNDGKPEQGFTTPAAYREHLKAYTKLSKQGIDKRVNFYQSQLHLMQLKIIAGILGVPLGDLTQRDKEYQLEQARLKAKKLRRWLGAVATLAISAISAGIFAYFQKEEAVYQKSLARKSEQIALEKQKLAQENLIEANHNMGLAFKQKADFAAAENELSYAYIYRLNSQNHLKPSSNEFNDNALAFKLNDFKNPVSIAEISLNSGGTALDLSVDNTQIVSGDLNGNVKLWDAKTGAFKKTFAGHSSTILSAKFSPNNNTLATTSKDRTIKIWNVNTGAVMHTLLGHTSSINNVAYSPNGLLLVSASNDKTLKLWNVNTGKLVRTFNGHLSSVNDVTFNTTGDFIVSASDDKTIQVWDTSSGNLINTFTKDLDCADCLYVLGKDSKKELEKHFDSVTSVAISPDSKIIASGSKDETIMLWDFASGKLIRKLIGHNGAINSIDFSPDGRTLVSGSDDKKIMIWDVENYKLKGILRGHLGRINSVIYDSVNRSIISASSDQTLKFWGIENSIIFDYNDLCVEQNSPNFYIADITLNNDEAVGTCRDNRVYFVDLTTGKVKKHYHFNKRLEDLFVYSPDGRLTAIIEDRKVTILDNETGKLKTKFQIAKRFYSVTFHPSENTLITSHKSGVLKYWSISSGKVLRISKPLKNTARKIIFSPDGTMFAALIDGDNNENLSVVDTATGIIKRDFEFDLEQNSVAFSSDSKLLAISSPQNTIHIWDIEKDEFHSEVGNTIANQSAMLSIAFSPDGKTISSSSIFEGVRSWSINTGKLLYVHDNGLGYPEIKYSDDGQYLMGIDSESGTLKRWTLGDTGSYLNKSTIDYLINQLGTTNISVEGLNLILSRNSGSDIKKALTAGQSDEVRNDTVIEIR
ncbi:TIR domain-containing protein [Pseudoalteromonas piscicida]|uniref:WD40 domain-containing protein n=1 Tax=Pseudoalteromonas piscicida TaxID=43662 RepID=UPI003C79E056